MDLLPPENTEAQTGKDIRVLIVEHDRDLRTHLKQILSNSGCSIATAETAKEAKFVFADHFSNVVLLDLFLPDMPGKELISFFKNAHTDVHIITMTDYNSEKLEKEVRSMGIFYYLIQPFEIGHLSQLIKHIKHFDGKGGNYAE